MEIKVKYQKIEYTIPIGVVDIKREGNDVTIVSFGKIIKEAYKAADELAKEGISCEIIDLRTVALDTYSISFCKKDKQISYFRRSLAFWKRFTEIIKFKLKLSII